MQARVQMTYLDAMSELLDSLGRPTCQTYPVLHKQISTTKMSLLGPVMSRFYVLSLVQRMQSTKHVNE